MTLTTSTVEGNSAGILGGGLFFNLGSNFSNAAGTFGVFASGTSRVVGNPLTISANFQIKGSYDLELSGNGVLNATTRTITVNNTGLSTLSGVLSGGAAGTALIKAGGGTMMLSGANTFTGTVQIDAGTLRIGTVAVNGTGLLHVAPASLDN